MDQDRVSGPLRRIRDAAGARLHLTRLAGRLDELEAEMEESRRLDRRLVQLTDVVQELLLPAELRDEEKLADFRRRASGPA